VAEPTEEVRIIVGPDRPALRAIRHDPHQTPGRVGQTPEDDHEEQILHAKNLLYLNIRAVGRLEPVSGEDGRSEATGESSPRPGARMTMDVAAYALARLLLVAVLTAVIYGVGHLLGISEFPLVVALLFAIVLALPLGIWVFAPLRRRATASIAGFDERRRSDREQLRARLRGEEPSSE
jgi:hypothetical protein